MINLMVNLIFNFKFFFYKKKIQIIHNVHRYLNLSHYFFIDKIIKEYRASGGLKSLYQSYKLYSLNNFLYTYKPVSILELGSGASTAIFAKYILSEGGHLDSVDENKIWLNNSIKIANISNRKNFTFKTLHPKLETINGVTCINYGLKSDKQFDLVFIDGPSLKFGVINSKNAVNADILRLVDINPPSFIIVDGRFNTVNFLKKYLKGRYKIELSALMKEGRLTFNYNYFSIFFRL